jgi:hypothetical protein
MPDTFIHNVKVSADSQRQSSRDQSANIATSGVLDEDLASVEAISLDPEQDRLEATIRGRYAAKVSRELEGLFGASGFDSVVVYTPGDSGGREGYYVLEDGTLERASMHDDRIQSVEGSIRRKGTRASHYRTITVQPVQERNDFGNETTAYVGLPSVATERAWYQSESKDMEAVSVVETKSGEGGDIDIVDAQSVSFTAPFDLIYSVPYDQEHPVGVVVWDTRGLSSKLDADDVLQWAKVYRTSHDYVGLPIIDTGRLRLEFDTTGGTLTATEWNDSTSTWDAVSLGTSDWQLNSLDVRSITPVRVEGRVGFENPSTGAEYAFRLVADRGHQAVQWLQPENESDPAPSGLIDLLAPVASASVLDVQPNRGLQARSEVTQ